MKNSSLIRTAVTVISILVSIGIIICAVLQLTERWDGAINVLVPLLGLNLLCQAYREWENRRKIAYFSIATAIFILICSIVVFFIK